MMLALGVGIVCAVLGYLAGLGYGVWMSRTVVEILKAERDEARNEARQRYFRRCLEPYGFLEPGRQAKKNPPH